jgi:hypothetical protein
MCTEWVRCSIQNATEQCISCLDFGLVSQFFHALP